jgi:hypothetical protein
MSYMKHDAVIVTFPDFAASRVHIAGFVASMPERFRPLIVGPIPSVINDYVTYVFAPDGSKEGWTDSKDGDRWRERFVRLFDFAYDDGSSPFNVVAVSFGGDQVWEAGGARIEYQHPAPPPSRRTLDAVSDPDLWRS